MIRSTGPVALIAAVLGILSAGCARSGGPLLSMDSVAAPALSPALRESRNRLNVDYRLAAPAMVSTRIEGAEGRSWPVYEGAWRPRAGTYRASLDGTVPGPGPNERRVLPDGDYRVVVQAIEQGRQEEASAPYSVRAADTSAPEIEDLSAYPDRISPNFDAEGDVAQITFRLTKAARVTPFAERITADGRRVREWTGEEYAAEAGQQRLQWDGVFSGRPVPDGDYEVGVRARDHGGNISEVRRPFSVAQGGRPEAKIVWAQIAPREILRGDPVCADFTVRNVGTTVLRTQGPEPGYVYDSFDTYASIADHAFVEHAGYWRVALDWAGFGSAIGARYPYRWGFGQDLAPGDEANVRGCVRVNDERTRMVFFGSLIQENVAIHDSGVGLVQVTVSP